MMAGIVLYSTGVQIPWLIPIIAIAIAAIVLKQYLPGYICLFAVLGWLFSLANRPGDCPEDIIGPRVTLDGEVVAVRYSSGAVRLTVDSHREGQPFRCSLLMPGAGREFQCGDSLRFTTRLRQTGSDIDLPDEISFNPTAYVDGISAEAYISPDDITITGYRNSPRRRAEQWHDRLLDLIYRSPVNSNSAWFLSATLLGDDSMLDPELREEFRATGVAHYLALSGFHVGIIAMLAGMLLFPLKTWSRAGRYRHLVVITLIWAYVIVCGMSASLVRAAVLITIFLLAKLIGRQSTPYNSLCVAAVAILAFSPRQLFSPGFQLSFAAVLSILILSPLLNPFSRKRHTAYVIASCFTVPVAAMAGTCLITMIHFHRLPLLFLVPNLLLGLLMPLLLSLGVMLMISTACGISFTIAGKIVDIIYSSVEYICSQLAHLPHAEITGIFLNTPAIIAGVITLILLTVALHYRRLVTLIAAIVAGLICVASSSLSDPLPDSELIVTRRPLRTDIVLRQDNRCMLVSTGDSCQIADALPDLSRRYSNYLSRRRCEPMLWFAPDSFNLGCIARRGHYLIFNDKTLLFSPELNTPIVKDVHIDYLLLTRRSGAQPERLIQSFKPDTILIAADMPSKRALRLSHYCDTTGIPYLNLKNAPFYLSASH